MQVRLAQIRDTEAITNVINAAFRKAEAFFIDGDRIDLESVRTLLDKGKFLVAEDVAQSGTDNSCVIGGCVYIELGGDRAYLGLLSVDPEHQNSGLGTILMNSAEDYCAQAGCRFVDLRIVNLRRELPGFYRRRGYTETGTAPFPPGFSPKLPCHFVEMSKRLK